jgi:hypothetical protein
MMVLLQSFAKIQEAFLFGTNHKQGYKTEFNAAPFPREPEKSL